MDLTAIKKEDNTLNNNEYDKKDEFLHSDLEKMGNIAPVQSQISNQMEVEGELDELQIIIQDLQDLKREEDVERGYKRKYCQKGESSKSSRKRMCTKHQKAFQVDKEVLKTRDSRDGDFQGLLKDTHMTNGKNKGSGKKSKLSISGQLQVASTSSQDMSVNVVLNGKNGRSNEVTTALVSTMETKPRKLRMNLIENLSEEPLILKEESTDSDVISIPFVEEKVMPIKTSENDGDVIFETIVTSGHQMLSGEMESVSKVLAIIDLTNPNTLVDENTYESGLVLAKTEAIDIQELQVKPESTPDNTDNLTPTVDNVLNETAFNYDNLDMEDDTEPCSSDPENEVVVIDVIDVKASSIIDEKFRTSFDRILNHLVSLELPDVEINIRLLQIHKFLSEPTVKCRQLMSIFSKNNANRYSTVGVFNGRLTIGIQVGDKKVYGNGAGKASATSAACRNALATLFGIDIDEQLRLINRNCLPKVETMMNYVRSFGVRSSMTAIQNHPAGLFIPLINVRSIAGEIVSNASKVVETLTKSRVNKEMLISAVSKVIIQGASCFVPKSNSGEVPQLPGSVNGQNVAVIMPIKEEPVEPQPSTSLSQIKPFSNIL